MWALTKRESDQEGVFDWGGDGGHLTGNGKWPTFGVA